jgi:hypothetical protein
MAVIDATGEELTRTCEAVPGIVLLPIFVVVIIFVCVT